MNSFKNLTKKGIVLTVVIMLMLLVSLINVSASDDKGMLDQMVADLEERVEIMEKEKANLVKENDKLKGKEEVVNNYNVPKGSVKDNLKLQDLGNFRSSAYDLSVQSCGKTTSHKYYGISSTGFVLKGKTREQAMAIAVDPKIIPLGTRVYIEFEEAYSHFNGIYTAVDTGGAIKSKKIDLFMGEFNNKKTHQSVWNFGIRSARVYRILE